MSSKFIPFFAAIALAAASVGTPAFAHDQATLDAMASAHGGQLRMAGIYHFELVVAPAANDGNGVRVHVYVTNHLSQQIPTAQASGYAVFMTGKTGTKVTLTPDGENGLVGTLAQAPKHGVQAIVTVAPLKGEAPQQARFTRLEAKVSPTAAHHAVPGMKGMADMHDMPSEQVHTN